MANKAMVLFFLAIMISPLIASVDKESVPVEAYHHHGSRHQAPAQAPESPKHHGHHHQALAKAPNSLEHHHHHHVHVPAHAPLPTHHHVEAPPSSIIRKIWV